VGEAREGFGVGSRLGDAHLDGADAGTCVRQSLADGEAARVRGWVEGDDARRIRAIGKYEGCARIDRRAGWPTPLRRS
jgi:hypothetical protein